MTDATEALDTLIAELDAYVPLSLGGEGDGTRAMHLNKLASKTLIDLRTERDAALAVIEKANKALALLYPGQDWHSDGNHSGIEWGFRAHNARRILVTAPTSALADRDARILEEAADEWHEPHDPSTYAVGDWLTARAASRRAEAHEGDREVSK